MKIGQFDSSQTPLVIAEIGNNHEGDVKVAEELVRQAASSGAQAVKFQTFRTELFVHPRNEDRFARMKQFELSEDEFRRLHDLTRSLDLAFVSTPLDLESARFLAPLVDAFKVASGDNNFYPLLQEVALADKPVIISSGVSDLQQIQQSKKFVASQWRLRGVEQELAVLHCVSNYPTLAGDANLAAIRTLADELECEVGYSDHTLGVQACVLAVALGAQIIEKHFTLDKNYSDFRDHQMSADPDELRVLVEQTRLASEMLGNGEKQVLDAESEMLPLIRRSIVAARDLPQGRRLTEDDFMWIRPADGLQPGQEQQLIGQTLVGAVPYGDPIRLSDVA
jgi:sialic acid synthase SpsE